jgi:peptidoglycan hydrolase-like protein with peptidoglycan-binding domain/cell wall-associated NlpC family hydrolase
MRHQRGESKLRRWATAIVLAVNLLAVGTVQPASAEPTAINLNSSSCPTHIRQGAGGGCVSELQRLLKQHGDSVTVDGIFGSGTHAAVRRFQSQMGLVVDGIVGPNTKNALYNSSTGGTVSDPRNLWSGECPRYLQQGQSGGCVTELQNLLNENGAHLVIDGAFGSATYNAVKAFQLSAGLPVDGTVGPATKDALYNASKGASGGPDLRSSACPAYMSEGQVDGCVATLQSLLTAHGYSLFIDRAFGPQTLAAVKSFQTRVGLAADGIVGSATKEALYRDVSSTPGAPTPVSLYSALCAEFMQVGERDGCVTELQSLLNSHGQRVAVDGIFGPATEYAVRCLQAALGLSVDGIVGPETKAALYGDDTQTSCFDPPDGSTSQPATTVTSQSGVERLSAAEAAADAACATGENVAPRVARIVDWLFEASRSPQQSTDQDRRYRNLVRQANANLYNASPNNAPHLTAIPYVWGGGHRAKAGPSKGTCYGYSGGNPCRAEQTVGLDCSGLVRWIYKLATGKDVFGPGNTDSQIKKGGKVTADKAVPGDLIFWGPSETSTNHVAIYMGSRYVNSRDGGIGTGRAIFEEWFTGSFAEMHLLGNREQKALGYYHYAF